MSASGVSLERKNEFTIDFSKPATALGKGWVGLINVSQKKCYYDEITIFELVLFNVDTQVPGPKIQLSEEDKCYSIVPLNQDRFAVVGLSDLYLFDLNCVDKPKRRKINLQPMLNLIRTDPIKETGSAIFINNRYLVRAVSTANEVTYLQFIDCVKKHDSDIRHEQYICPRLCNLHKLSSSKLLLEVRAYSYPVDIDFNDSGLIKSKVISGKNINCRVKFISSDGLFSVNREDNTFLQANPKDKKIFSPMKISQEIAEKFKYLNAIGFLPDNRLLMGSDNKNLTIVNLKDFSLVEVDLIKKSIEQILVSPEGNVIVLDQVGGYSVFTTVQEKSKTLIQNSLPQFASPLHNIISGYCSLMLLSQGNFAKKQKSPETSMRLAV